MKRVGIIGYPLRHSLSPVFQQAAFDALGLEVRYESWETEPPRLQQVVESLRQDAMLGANVTIPYKEQVLRWLHELDPLARQIGAVNTIVHYRGRLIGHNTDVPGFLKALHREGSFEPSGKRVLLLGAGGAARAVAFGLANADVAALAIVNRTMERARLLADDLRRLVPSVAVHSWDERQLLAVAQNADLIVNCTPMGMRHTSTEGQSPLPEELLPAEALVCDLVYNPLETPLLLAARRAGARGLGGLPMLIYQGALAFELWTGRQPPIEVMFAAARESLEERG